MPRPSGLRSSQILSFARLRSGQPGKLPPPDLAAVEALPEEIKAQVAGALACSATGSRETVRRQLGDLVEAFQPDELMVTGMIHDHAARIRSFEIAADVLREMAEVREPA